MTFIPRMTRTAAWSVIWLWLASALGGYEIGRWIDGRHGGTAAILLFVVGLFLGPVCIDAVRRMSADEFRMEGAVRESIEADVRRVNAQTSQDEQ